MIAMSDISMVTASERHLRLSRTAAQPAESRPAPAVFVINDDETVREALGSRIRRSGWQTETFATARQFFFRSTVPCPSCLVLDIAVPDLKGAELQRRIAANHIDMPIILTRGHGDVVMMVQATRGDAVELVKQPFGDDELVSAVAYAIEHSETALQHEAEVQALRDRHATLSRRERQVMELVVTGLLNKVIAYELGISEITVKAHRGRMMRKMQVRTLADLIKIAASLGLTGNREPGAPRVATDTLPQPQHFHVSRPFAVSSAGYHAA